MKRLIALLAASVAATAGITSSAWAATATEARSVGNFKAVATSGSIDLAIKQGDRTSVQVQADDKVLPLIETVVEGDTLQVRFQHGARVYSAGKMKVTIVTPALNAVSIAGAGDAELSAIRTEQLAVSIAGSGDVVYSGAAVVKSSVVGSGSVSRK